jgi:hypothetical protein
MDIAQLTHVLGVKLSVFVDLFAIIARTNNWASINPALFVISNNLDIVQVRLLYAQK